MVRPLSILLALILTGAAGQATAQAVDWSRAGGHMFGEPAGLVQQSEDDDVRLPATEPPFREAIAEAAARHGIDARLLQALVLTESGFRPDAVSSAGAAGLTQLMPGTARELGVGDRFDPVENLRGGAAYLARQLARFKDLRLALAAYNAGPARVAAAGGVPRIRETEQYVETVVACFLALTAGRDVRSARACGSPEARR